MARPLSTPSLFGLLLRQQVRRVARSFASRSDRVVLIILGLLGCYLGFTLLIMGWRFDVLAGQMLPGAEPLGLVHRQMISMLGALFGMRFLFEKTPRLHLEPFRHLPLRGIDLVVFFSGIGLISVHTLFPLLFAVPFALVQIAPVHGTAGALTWLSGVVTLLAGSHFLNLYLRSALTKHEKLFMLGLSGFLLITFVDEYIGTNVISTASLVIFGLLAEGDLWTLASIALLTPAAAFLALGTLLQVYRTDLASAHIARKAGRLHQMAERWDLAGHLVWLELRLMWRNRRPRHYLLISVMFSTVYLVFMLASRELFGGLLFGAVVGLFASGGFALNYGQLMFGWDSTYFDGLLTRSIRTRILTRSKLMILQGSCLVLFALSLPLFLWLRPDLVPLHVAFLFYNAGITSQLVLELATRNRERIELSRSGGFLNYEGFSARHWLWFVPTAVPPTLLLVALRDQPGLAWTLLGVIGIVGLALSEFWTRRHAAVIDRNKYSMAAGFRGDA